MEIWQTTNLDGAVAEEFFGWKWMAYMGIPVRTAKDYPKERLVRQFMSPGQLAMPQWVEFFAQHEGREADGTEDLSYRYCSSVGPEMVPHFSGHESAVALLEQELRKRKLWGDYRNQLWAQISEDSGDPATFEIDEARLAAADCKSRCIAALVIVRGKFVRIMEPEDAEDADVPPVAPIEFVFDPAEPADGAVTAIRLRWDQQRLQDAIRDLVSPRPDEEIHRVDIDKYGLRIYVRRITE